MRGVTIIPIEVKPPLTRPTKDLGGLIYEKINDNGVGLVDGDIVVVSSKLVSIAQGRLYDEEMLNAMPDSRRLASDLGVSEKVAEAVLRESIRVVGGGAGLLMSYRPEGLVPNSGIDKSNSPNGLLVLYPLRPFRTADEIRERLYELSGRRLGVVISDSRVLPLRQGTVGLSIGYSGLKGVVELRGARDLFGRPLVHTRFNLADCVCSAALLVMGESDEGVPIAVVRGLRDFVDDKSHKPLEHLVEFSECLYMRSLGVSKRRNDETDLRALGGLMHLL